MYSSYPECLLTSTVRLIIKVPLAIICYFRDKSECALWFAETYGLLPKSLIVEEKETGLSHEVQFSPGMANWM